MLALDRLEKDHLVAIRSGIGSRPHYFTIDLHTPMTPLVSCPHQNNAAEKKAYTAPATSRMATIN